MGNSQHLEKSRSTAGKPPSRLTASAGCVVTYAPGNDPRSHESVTRTVIARKVAEIKGFQFAGEHDPLESYRGPVYFVPGDTLVGTETASVLGIHGGDDLFGAVVPHRFVATKAITHSLIDASATAPEGWSRDFGTHVQHVVLRGFTAFSSDDAQRGAQRLLEKGPVRVKRTSGIGGSGQFEVRGLTELAKALDSIDADEITQTGVVVEENLVEVKTYSVGRLHVAGLALTYVGTQRATPNNRGADVYGGSDLLVVKGDFDTLLELELSDPARLAIAQARVYDEAASLHYPAMFASRRNYDVAQGVDASGSWRSGVLEQSWRIGGASGAEVGALEAFKADPARGAVRASCVEVYGEQANPPPGAAVLFRGVDPRVGAITKYALIEADDHA